MEENNKVVIIGAGISGLIAAIELERNGFTPVIYEASASVGGRVKTDEVNGFKLDHGFQVLLTAYPEAQKYLDYQSLNLQSFNPGAVIYDGKGTFALSDPLRQPSTIFSMLFSSVGSVSDKFKMWSISRMLKKKSIDDIFTDREATTFEYLANYGFSERIINYFFKPFFSGIFLEDQLVTSSRMFEFVFKMFSEGNAAIPASGMQEIPNQLAAQLNNTEIHFNKKVDQVKGLQISFLDSENIEAEKIIIACDPYRILPGLANQTQDYHSVINLYFATSKSSINKPLIGLVPGDSSLINNFNFMTDVSQMYAPKGKHLLSISVVKKVDIPNDALINNVKNEFHKLTGHDIKSMEFIKMYKIKQALPILEDIQASMHPTATRIQDKVFLAGDYLLNGSLNAAMASGRAAAIAAISN